MSESLEHLFHLIHRHVPDQYEGLPQLVDDLPCPLWALCELQPLGIDEYLEAVGYITNIMSAPEGVLTAFFTELTITCR